MTPAKLICEKCGNRQIDGIWCMACGNRFVQEQAAPKSNLFSTVRLVAVVVLIGLVYFFHKDMATKPKEVQAVEIQPSQSGVLNQVMKAGSTSSDNTGPTGAQIFNRAAPGIVTIYESHASGRAPAILGAGFLLNDTTIATNYHVVRNAATMIVRFADNSSVKVKARLGYSESHDVALLEIDPVRGKSHIVENGLDVAARQLHNAAESNTASGTVADAAVPTSSSVALPIGSAAALAIGDSVVAVGSPQGLHGTLAQGIITGANGSILQTNLPVSSSSSGGPLLNMRGQVVGILTSQSVGEGNSGTNIALPIDWATSLLDDRARKSLGDDAGSAGPSGSDHGFGPYTFKLGAQQKRSVAFSTPKDLNTVQFFASLAGASAGQLHATILRNGRLMYDSGDDTRFQLGLKPGDYVLVVENTASSASDVSVKGAFSAQ